METTILSGLPASWAGAGAPKSKGLLVLTGTTVTGFASLARKILIDASTSPTTWGLNLNRPWIRQIVADRPNLDRVLPGADMRSWEAELPLGVADDRDVEVRAVPPRRDEDAFQLAFWLRAHRAGERGAALRVQTQRSRRKQRDRCRATPQ